MDPSAGLKGPGLPDDLSRKTLDNFPLSMVLSDPRKADCPIVYVNEAFARTTGYSASDAIGRNCRFLQGKRTNERDRATIRNALAAEESVTVDILNYRKNQQPFMNRLIITPLHDDDSGELLYFLGIQTELTVANDVESRNIELDERLKELQHRVKNHLSMILAMIRIEADGQPNAEAYADVLGRRVEALALLYDEFGQNGSSDERVDLGAYLSRIAAANHALCARPNVRLNVDLAHVEANMDEAGRLGLYLSEVLTNSFRHAFEPRQAGVVTVTLRRMDSEGRTALTVSDDGAGMPLGVWPREESLGGQIVLRLTERIGGQIDVGPNWGGRGTAITLTFRCSPPRCGEA